MLRTARVCDRTIYDANLLEGHFAREPDINGPRKYHEHVIIADTPNYRLVSIGNGLSYSLTNKATGSDAFFQGDDAAIFREAFDDMGNADPERVTDDILRELWGQYDCVVAPAAPSL